MNLLQKCLKIQLGLDHYQTKPQKDKQKVEHIFKNNLTKVYFLNYNNSKEDYI